MFHAMTVIVSAGAADFIVAAWYMTASSVSSNPVRKGSNEHWVMKRQKIKGIRK